MPQLSSNDLKKLHVLIVDDDPAMLDAMDMILKSIGISQVTRAGNNGDAVACLTTGGRVVDCILCDYSMPEGSGLRLLQAVRTGKIKYCRPDASFLLVTASGERDTVEAAALLDVSGYLVKPVTPAKLQSAILHARGKAIQVDIAKYSQVVLL